MEESRGSVVVQGAKALTASNRRTVGRWVPRESEVSLRSWGVGEQERSLTGAATAMRCADTFPTPAAICNADLERHGDLNCASRQRDATGERSVSLAKMCETQTQFVVTHTSCSRRKTPVLPYADSYRTGLLAHRKFGEMPCALPFIVAAT